MKRDYRNKQESKEKIVWIEKPARKPRRKARVEKKGNRVWG